MTTNLRKSTRRIWDLGIRVLVLILVLWSWIGADGAMAVQLGDKVDRTSFTTQVGRGVSLRATQYSTGLREEQALVNEANEVFGIEVTSQEEQPPQASEYLGDYARFERVELELIPLRGRVEIYQLGDRRARWSVYGYSGHFTAEALGFDLMPSALMEE